MARFDRPPLSDLKRAAELSDEAHATLLEDNAQPPVGADPSPPDVRSTAGCAGACGPPPRDS